MSGWKDACKHRSATLNVDGVLVCGDCGKTERKDGSWLRPGAFNQMGELLSTPTDITVITKSGAYFEERSEAGAYVRLEDVAALVKAARAVVNSEPGDVIYLLEQALKPFEGP